jgi:hypothetical protein
MHRLCAGIRDHGGRVRGRNGICSPGESVRMTRSPDHTHEEDLIFGRVANCLFSREWTTESTGPLRFSGAYPQLCWLER